MKKKPGEKKLEPMLTISISEKEAWLLREAISFSCHEGFGSREKRRTLADIAETRILRELLKVMQP